MTFQNAFPHFLTSLGLCYDPFTTSPDPHFFYPLEQHKRCLNQLEISLRLRRGACLVLGEIGIGKTTLCRVLLKRIASDLSIEPYLLLTPVSENEFDFIQSLSCLFKLSTEGLSKARCFQRIKDFLFLKGVENNKTVVLIIDEAQKLSLESIEILRSFLNFETNEFKLLQLLLFSQEEMREKLREVPNFVDRLNVKCELKPLTLQECSDLIRYRLNQAGYRKRRSLFSSQAIELMFELTGGSPRKLCMFAHKIIEYLVMFQRYSVDREMVERLFSFEVALT